MQTGWLTLNNKTYYLAKDNDGNGYSVGAMYSNICAKIDNKFYCFDGSGYSTERTDLTGIATKPTNSYCKNITYNGSEQTLTNTAGTGYTFSGNKGTNVGSYTVTAKLKSGYIWKNNTTNDVTFTCTIKSASSNLLGDVNSDGVVNKNDAKLLAKYIIGSNVDVDLTVSDYNQDGKIKMNDVMKILKAIK